jgi:hypothetical protein
MHTTSPRIALTVGALLAASAALADATAPTQTPGTWTKHHYSFAFMGFTSTYSCDGLADKLKELLITAGARPDAVSNPGACASSFGHPDKFARADLTFYTLAPAGGPAPAESPTAKPKPDQPTGPPVGGIWRPVKFVAYSPHDLGIGDCELIDQFRQNILPMFTTRNVQNNVSCVPYQNSGSQLDLRFDTFAAAPKLAAAIPGAN